MEHEKFAYIGVDNIILNEKGQALLGKRPHFFRVHPGKWGLIGGFVDYGETIEQACKREAKEEIGCEIEIIRFTGRYYDTLGRHPKKTVVCLLFISKITEGTPKTSNEVTDVKWFDPEKIKDMDLAYDHKKMLEDEGII